MSQEQTRANQLCLRQRESGQQAGQIFELLKADMGKPNCIPHLIPHAGKWYLLGEIRALPPERVAQFGRLFVCHRYSLFLGHKMERKTIRNFPIFRRFRVGMRDAWNRTCIQAKMQTCCSFCPGQRVSAVFSLSSWLWLRLRCPGRNRC